MKEKYRTRVTAVGAFLLGVLLPALAAVPYAVGGFLGVQKPWLVIGPGILVMASAVFAYGFMTQIRISYLFILATVGTVIVQNVLFPGFPGIAFLFFALMALVLGTVGLVIVEHVFPEFRTSCPLAS